MLSEQEIDAEKLLYLMILNFVLDEMKIVYPSADLSPGSKLRMLAERIASRLCSEAGDQEIPL